MLKKSEITSLTTEVEARQSCRYPIVTGIDLWDELLKFCSENYAPRNVILVVDENVYRFHGEEILSNCQTYFDKFTLIRIPEGEQSKSVGEWNNVLDKLLKNSIERETPLLAIGGGVTGDLAGFAAATALRGIPLIHMPTTLLAMVDSSIGGKTGVNHSSGKNLIGSFYQPDAVFADIRFLTTLDDREWRNGLAEVLKYAAIEDPGLFDEVAILAGGGFDPSSEWLDLIYKSGRIKAAVVREDTLESGKRAYLNFGHTFGHALEKKAGFGTISHGEAVFVGMLAAVFTSREMGAEIDEARFDPFISLYQLDPGLKTIARKDLIEAMRQDKKVKNEQIRLILLDDWGKPCMKKCEDEQLLVEAWDFAFSRMKLE